MFWKSTTLQNYRNNEPLHSFMFSHILTALLSILLFQASPSVLWKATVNHSEGNSYQLVVKGEVAQDYYVHPMADPYVGTELQVETGDGVATSGDPAEEFTPEELAIYERVRRSKESFVKKESPTSGPEEADAG